MNMASLTGVVMASRRPVNSAVAMARLSPSSDGPNRSSIASRKPCMNRGVAQRQPAADRRLHGLDRAGDKAGSADALEKHIAAEIIAARPQRREGGCNRAFNSTKLPTSGAVPLRTDSRTRSSWIGARGASICVTRSTKRSVRSRISRASTKPDSDTEYSGLANTAWPQSAVLHVATAKPAAIAAIITATGNTFCRRSRNAAAQAVAATAVTHATGS